jgi:geranylgeranyl diphosphate synthase type II
MNLVNQVLDEYGDLARGALFERLPTREPRKYLYDLVADYPRRGGRGMRPALHIASARAHGATLEQALATATSIELLHNALLVIDDIQDESEQRRGQPALHRQHGMPLAMNVGTSTYVLSLIPLLDNVTRCGPQVALWVIDRAIAMAEACAEGQALELGWRRDNVMDLLPADYFDMVLRKTCSYSTIFPIEAGAIIGTRRPDVHPAVLRYAFLVGAAFQVQDDYLNLASSRPSYGKETYGDLYEGKRTLITITLLDRCTPGERAEIRAFLALPRESKTAEQVARVMELVRRYDCLERARQYVQRLLGAAQVEFDIGFAELPPSRDREFLRQFPLWVVEQP